MKTKQKGFSLIELLIVIAIIASIVAMAIPNYLSVRQRASDSKKKSEMAQLKNALRLYYNDFNTYPADSGGPLYNKIKGCYSAIDGDGKGECPCSANIDFAPGAACDNIYMKKFPSSWGAATNPTYYYKAASGDDFCLRAILDNKSDPDIATSQSRCYSACNPNCNTTGRYCVCGD